MFTWWQIVIGVLIANAITGTVATHIYWLFYATNETTGEYYRHPIFEPDFWGPLFPELIKHLAGLFLLGWLQAMLSGFWMGLHADALAVTVETSEVDNRKRWWKLWKFWRWGMHIVPRSMALPWPHDN